MTTGRALGLAAAVVALSGCVAQSPGQLDMSVDPSLRTEAQLQMLQATNRAVQAQETLARIERARTPPAASSLDETTLPDELRRKSTVEFQGPAIEVARSLAEYIGYAFIETGPRPQVPGLVGIDAKDLSVGKVLEDIGLQAQKFATVIVDPNMKRIEFRNEASSGAIAAAVETHRAARVYHRVARRRIVVAPTCVPCSVRPVARVVPAERAAAPAVTAAPVPAVPAAPVRVAAPGAAAPARPAARSAPAAAMPAGIVPVGPGTGN